VAKKNLSPWCAARGGAEGAADGAAARLCAAEAAAGAEEDERQRGAAEFQRLRGWDMADTESARRGQTSVLLLRDTRRPTTLISLSAGVFPEREQGWWWFFFLRKKEKIRVSRSSDPDPDHKITHESPRR